MESLQNRVATHFGVTPLFSMRAVSLASSQHCRGIDADVWCKRTLITITRRTQGCRSHTTKTTFIHLPVSVNNSLSTLFSFCVNQPNFFETLTARKYQAGVGGLSKQGLYLRKDRRELNLNFFPSRKKIDDLGSTTSAVITYIRIYTG